MKSARRAICEPLWPRTLDSTASLPPVSLTVLDDAVEAAVRRRKSRSSHTPNEHQNWCPHGARDACNLRAA
eukprot:1386003-Lingulodinium_polyedra.AAC.1